MRGKDAIAITGIGMFSRVESRVESGSNQEITIRGDGMAPLFRTGDKVQYNPAVTLASLDAGGIVVEEQTAGTFRVARLERQLPSGEWIVKMDGKTLPEAERLRPERYRGAIG
jgi:phage repressor protein C with HTH and peptisase S24 domain